MANDVDICNQGLVLIGDEEISALTDDNARARAARRFYVPTRDATLRAHPWNFAICRAVLALETATPAFGWAYQFALPNDPYCLRVLETEDLIRFAVERRMLMTDESAVKIKFVSRVENPNEFDSLFVDTLACRMAWKLAITLTKEVKVVEMAWKMYQDALQEARSIDGMEGTPVVTISNDLENARHGSGTFNEFLFD
jgi:hypothetical protein